MAKEYRVETLKWKNGISEPFTYCYIMFDNNNNTLEEVDLIIKNFIDEHIKINNLDKMEVVSTTSREVDWNG